MKEIKPPKESDQENVEKAIQLILDLMAKHTEIEETLWAGAVFSVLVNGYRNCDFSHKEFCQEVKKISEHYKGWWDNDN